MNRTLKAGLVSLVRHAGLAAPLRRRLGGRGVILCLHEIQEDPASELSTGCTPAFLAEIVEALRRDGFDWVSLDEAIARLGGEQSARPFAALTFDDGYRDNLTLALPVLDKLQAPFTVYVPTHAVTRELYAWWLALRALFRTQADVDVACMGKRFACAGPGDRVAALQEAGRWVAQDFQRARELAPTFAAYGISVEALVDAYFLDASEVRALARNALATIGAHTTSHAALMLLEEKEARAEMADNKAFLEQLLDRDARHLAYPYGLAHAGPDGREAKLAEEVGFASAVRSRESPVFSQQRCNLFGIPRIRVRPEDSLATLYYRISGLAWAFKARKPRFAYG